MTAHRCYIRPANAHRERAVACDKCEWVAPLNEVRLGTCADCGSEDTTYTVGIYGGELSVCFACAARLHTKGDAMNCTATTRLTAEECLARLDALRPMPRGLRLEAYAEDKHGVPWCQNRNPLWLDLFDGDGIPISVSQKGEATWPDPKVIRRWAAPVRRLREERRALRARVRELEEHVAAGLWACGGEP